MGFCVSTEFESECSRAQTDLFLCGLVLAIASRHKIFFEFTDVVLASRKYNSKSSTFQARIGSDSASQ